MSTLRSLLALVGCGFIIYQIAKPFFRKEDHRLKDWVKKQKQNQRK